MMTLTKSRTRKFIETVVSAAKELINVKGEKDELILLSAKECYEKAADPQWDAYVREINSSRSRGYEYCYLLSDCEHTIREEHAARLQELGFELDITKRNSILDENRPSWWCKCYWTRDVVMTEYTEKEE